MPLGLIAYSSERGLSRVTEHGVWSHETLPLTRRITSGKVLNSLPQFPICKMGQPHRVVVRTK